MAFWRSARPQRTSSSSSSSSSRTMMGDWRRFTELLEAATRPGRRLFEQIPLQVRVEPGHVITEAQARLLASQAIYLSRIVSEARLGGGAGGSSSSSSMQASGSSAAGRQHEDDDPGLAAELRDLRDLHKQHRSRRRVCLSEAPTRPAQQRWKPNKEQLEILESFYQKQTPPSQERIKEIAAIISQHGAVDESKVYYWFQNRRSREKRKRRRMGLEAASSESAKAQQQQQIEHVGGAAHVEAAAVDKGGGGGDDFMQQVQQQHQQQQQPVSSMWHSAAGAASTAANTSLQLSQSQFSDTCSSSGYENEAAFTHMFDVDSEEGEQDSCLAKIMVDGKCHKSVSGMVDVKGFFGEGAVLVDSLGCIVPMNEQGFTLQPLQPGKRYDLVLPVPRAAAAAHEEPPQVSAGTASPLVEFPKGEIFSNLEDPSMELWDFSSWS